MRGVGRFSEEIWGAFQELRDSVHGHRLQLAEIVKILQRIMSLQHTFILFKAVDECIAVN